MNRASDALRRVHCPACDWQAAWGSLEMLAALRKLGMLRREKEPEVGVIIQLAEASANRLDCQVCGRTGLQLAPWLDEFDDPADALACELCGRPIPVERRRVIAGATRCAACQDQPESAANEHDFCPRCGAHLQLQLGSGRGISRYRSVCSACGYREKG